MLRLLFAAVFVVASSGSWAQVIPPTSSKIVAPLSPLLEVLAKARVSGSLVLSSRCSVGPAFPNLRSPSKDTVPTVEAVREMFADDSAIQVTQDGDGMIRVVEDGTETELLNVKISQISFENKGVPLKYAAFSRNAALKQILDSPEVVAFMKAHDLKMVPRPQGLLVNQSFPDNSPHVSESMTDVTLAQALDRVLKTFPGIWFYQNCPQQEGRGRSVFLAFLDLQQPGLIQIEEP